MSVWLHLAPDKSTAPRPARVPNAPTALEWAAREVHDGKKRASKDRVDLAALSTHCGTSYSQVELVPQSVFDTVRDARASVVALVLLPAGTGAGSAAGEDAVALFHDAAGSLKGLPPNDRAGMLAAAAGLAGRKFYGDVVLGRLAATGAGGDLALGGEASGQFMVERDWLEKAQVANKAGVACPLQELLQARLDEGRRRAIAAALQAQAQPTPTPAEAQPTPAEAAPAGGGAPLGVLRFEDAGPDATATVRVPEATKTKHVRCVFKDQHLKLEVSTLPEGSTCVADGPTFQTVRPDGCNWTLQDTKEGRVLSLSLEKAKQMTWLMLIRG